MLYNPQLKTFLAVATAGSFNKAAESLFITPTAVIKQINLLENDVGVPLFRRTHRGLLLTDAGTTLQEYATRLITLSEEAARQAKNASHSGAVIRVGSSPMTPGQFLVPIWPRISARSPGLKFQLVPFENTPENARHILAHLGETIDIVPGLFDADFLASRKCAALSLWPEPLCCAVSLHHPLAAKDSLTMEDLAGETLMVIRRGWNSAIDTLRDDLTQNHPNIRIMDFDFYNTAIFNRCENEGRLLLTIRTWQDVHPLLKILPVAWDHTIPFGLLHAPEPSPAVLHFLEAVRETVEET